jgi:hypothetical protein
MFGGQAMYQDYRSPMPSLDIMQPHAVSLEERPFPKEERKEVRRYAGQSQQDNQQDDNIHNHGSCVL